MRGSWDGIVDIIAALPLDEWRPLNTSGECRWAFHCEVDGVDVQIAEKDGEWVLSRFLRVVDRAAGEELVYVGGWDWLGAGTMPRRVLVVLRALIRREEAALRTEYEDLAGSFLRRMGRAVGVPR